MKKIFLCTFICVELYLCSIVLISSNFTYDYNLNRLPSTNLVISEDKQSRGIATQQIAQIHNLTGENISIAFLDSGINLTHESFARFDNQIPYYEVSINHSTIAPDMTSIRDFHGHGTHVASIALGNSNTFRGVAPAANCIMINCFDSPSTKIANWTIIDHAMEWILDYAHEYPLDVLSISIGAPKNPLIQDTITPWIQNLTIQGITVVVSVGNQGLEEVESVNIPAISPYAISVGAMDFDLRIPCEWNGHGLIDEDYIKPDLLAPGVEELGADMNNSYAYRRLTGSSQATPYVSGIIALLMQYCREHMLNFNPLIFKWLLEMGAWRFTTIPSILPDTTFGWGLIQLEPVINLLELNQSAKILNMNHQAELFVGEPDSLVKLIPCWLSVDENLVFKVSSSNFALGLYDQVPNRFGQPVLLYSSIKSSSLAVRVNNSGIYYFALKGSRGISPQNIVIQLVVSRDILLHIAVDAGILIVFMIGFVGFYFFDRYLRRMQR